MRWPSTGWPARNKCSLPATAPGRQRLEQFTAAGGRAKRTYLRDDGTPFPAMATRVSEANRAALKAALASVAPKP